MKFKPSGIMHDLRLLKERFPHVKDSVIIQKYRQVFREIATGAKNREFLPLLAKRYTGEALEAECAAEKPQECKTSEAPLQQTIPTAKPKIRERVASFFRKMLESNEIATG